MSKNEIAAAAAASQGDYLAFSKASDPADKAKAFQ
jgi:hypothetical protein